MRRFAQPAILLAALTLAACKENHSALAPHGPAAQQIANLTWLLFALVGFVILLVMAVLWFALWGPDRIRAQLARTQAIVIGGIVFPAVTLTALLVYGLSLTRATPVAGPQQPLQIEVVGEQWWWRVLYKMNEGAGFESANEIRIPVGREIGFVLRSADVIHSFWVPSLAGKVDMIPGRATTLRITADRPGIYRGACAEYCGGPHAFMAFHVIAMPQAEFETWLTSANAVSEPASDIGRQGQALFIGAGCGGCHAIAGTSANGAIGPNLTKLGGRPSIGAGLMPMTQSNLAHFIVSGQHLKPGNKMPPFGIFREQELDALTAYLIGLK